MICVPPGTPEPPLPPPPHANAAIMDNAPARIDLIIDPDRTRVSRLRGGDAVRLVGIELRLRDRQTAQDERENGALTGHVRLRQEQEVVLGAVLGWRAVLLGTGVSGAHAH